MELLGIYSLDGVVTMEAVQWEHGNWTGMGLTLDPTSSQFLLY